MNKDRNMEDLISNVVTECVMCEWTDESTAELMVILVQQILCNEDNIIEGKKTHE